MVAQEENGGGGAPRKGCQKGYPGPKRMEEERFAASALGCRVLGATSLPFKTIVQTNCRNNYHWCAIGVGPRT